MIRVVFSSRVTVAPEHRQVMVPVMPWKDSVTLLLRHHFQLWAKACRVAGQLVPWTGVHVSRREGLGG